MFFLKESEYDIRFLDKSIIKKLLNFKIYLSLFNTVPTEETKTFIIAIYYMKKDWK